MTRKSARVRRRFVAAGRALGLDAAQMAAKAGIPRSTMSKYVSGAHNPMGVRRDLIEELAEKWEREARERARALSTFPKREKPAALPPVPKGNGGVQDNPLPPRKRAEPIQPPTETSHFLAGYRQGYRDGYADGVKRARQMIAPTF